MTSLFAILLNIVIVAGSFISVGRISLLFAAVASIGVLMIYGVVGINQPYEAAGFVQAGFLGATFFAIAMLGYRLSKRAKENEILAKKRGIKLKSLEKINEMIINRMGAGVIVLDQNNVIKFMNKSACELLGGVEMPINKSLDFVSSRVCTELINWKSSNVYPSRYQSNIVDKNLLLQFVSLAKESGLEPLTLVFVEDSTAVSGRAQRLKLVSLGRLTASIAHEIRNPLSAVSQAAQLLIESPENYKQHQRLVKIIHSHSDRMNRIIENILELSRRKDATPSKIKLKSFLENFIEDDLLHQWQDAKIEVVVKPEDLTVTFDCGQLQQILANLAENGLVASMDNIGKPRLTIKAEQDLPMSAVIISVIDQGKGISPDRRPYIFDPFYTTKRQGTGLGLYIVNELCETNNARVVCEQSANGGSCFKVIIRN
jgi:two-component system sensor histidine kinase PilS (NtrC family)